MEWIKKTKVFLHKTDSRKITKTTKRQCENTYFFAIYL